jgi:capsular exopolysaccharide synthesis family protein
MTQSNVNYNDDEIDLGELTKVLWRRKWFIIVFVVLVSTLASTFISQMPDVYKSNVLIMFKKSSTSSDPIQNLLSGSFTSVSSTETELELIKGRRFSSQIVDELKLDSRPEFAIPLPEDLSMTVQEFTDLRRKKVIDIVLGNITVDKKAGSELISISYQSTDPKLAALIANAIGNTFVTFKENLMSGKHIADSRLIADKVNSVKQSLEKAEFHITAYQKKHDFTDIESAIGFSHSKLVKVHAQKQALDTKIEQSNILKSHIRQSGRDVDALLAIPMLVTSSIVNAAKQEVNSEQKSFDKVKLTYGTKHPKYIEAHRLFNDAKSHLLFEIDKQVKQIDKQLEIHKDNLSYVENEIETHTLRLRQLGVINFDYQKLKHEFDTYLTLYRTLIKKKNESDLMQGLSNSSNTILVEKAEISSIPVNPKRNLMLALAVIGSLLISVLIVFIEVALGDKILQLKRVAMKFETKVIGTIPKIKIKSSHKNNVLIDISRDKYPAFIEAIRSIRTNMLLDNERSKQKVIAITSISPNDGKSSLSIQLADCFSELENVILVDADLRFPSIANALGKKPDHPGLTNLISESHTLKQSTIRQKKYKFDVIGSGDIPNNPLACLSNPRLEKVIGSIKSKYDRVILECPPIMSVSDAYIISKHVDSVYLVLDAQKTNSNMLNDVLEELKQANLIVAGILINKVKENNTYYSTKYYRRKDERAKDFKLA